VENMAKLGDTFKVCMKFHFGPYTSQIFFLFGPFSFRDSSFDPELYFFLFFNSSFKRGERKSLNFGGRERNYRLIPI
jgi:hypothetical protein